MSLNNHLLTIPPVWSLSCLPLRQSTTFHLILMLLQYLAITERTSAWSVSGALGYFMIYPLSYRVLAAAFLVWVTSMEILVSEYDNCAFARQWCCMTMQSPWIRRYNFHAQLLSLLLFTFGMNRLSGSGRLLYAFDSWYVPWSHRKGFNGACQRYYFS